MTERATLEALLARVLEGTGPDRELDAEIARAIGWKPLYHYDGGFADSVTTKLIVSNLKARMEALGE